MTIPIDIQDEDHFEELLSKTFSKSKFDYLRRELDGRRGYINVGDGCWRRNVLMTNLRFW